MLLHTSTFSLTEVPLESDFTLLEPVIKAPVLINGVEKIKTVLLHNFSGLKYCEDLTTYFSVTYDLRILKKENEKKLKVVSTSKEFDRKVDEQLEILYNRYPNKANAEREIAMAEKARNRLLPPSLSDIRDLIIGLGQNCADNDRQLEEIGEEFYIMSLAVQEVNDKMDLIMDALGITDEAKPSRDLQLPWEDPV